MLLTKQGMYFITISMRPGVPAKFFFNLNTTESAYRGKCIKGAFEYEPDKFLVLANGINSFLFTQRNNMGKTLRENHAIPNPSEDKYYHGLKPFPGFDIDSRPYVLIKDRLSLTVVNLKTKQSMIVVRRCPFKWDCIRDYTLDIALSDDEKEIEIFTIEGELRDIVNA